MSNYPLSIEGFPSEPPPRPSVGPVDTYTAIHVKDGDRVSVPTFVRGSSEQAIAELRDAMHYFERHGSESERSILTETGNSPIEAGVYHPENTPEWGRLRKRLFSTLENKGDSKTVRYISQLEACGVAAWVIDMIQDDLDISANEAKLRTYADSLDNEDRDTVLKALETARKGHQGQTQKREKDREGLDNIPYLNHPVQVANLAVKIGLDPKEVQAGLLHDVVEDTPVNEDELRQDFSPETVGMVLDMTRRDDESREAFMERVASLEGGSKILKCLDRYHNVIRAFSINDPDYIERVLTESRDVYLPAFMEIPELSGLALRFDEILEELAIHRESMTQSH